MHVIMCGVCTCRFITGPIRCMMPSLDQKCSPEGCWYCSDVCHHCMQPSITLYSGMLQDNLLKFCSKECKAFWFPSPNQKTLHASSYLHKTCESDEDTTEALLMTVIIQKDNSVEHIYLSADKNMARPFIVWHVKELKCQHFAHFYISENCLPLNSVWAKQVCSSESEIMSSSIAPKRADLQAHFLKQLNEAVKLCGFDSFESFLKASNGVSLQDGKFMT